MKEVHLICNAHLDPIWQWEWEEGAAAALATFRSAADLADEFDYIFCHNEVTLYKYIAEYAPDLYARIKELIRKGRWKIMGGWYLQPDCNMPAGESFVRHILVGRKYFMENFGQAPTTAINFDAFGHTRGLVQIMNKCGQDSVIITRPGNEPLPSCQFYWKGFDDSTVKVAIGSAGYNTPMGGAAGMVNAKAHSQGEDVICVLWGVGNHGGGPSRKDLCDLEKLMQECLDNGTMKMIHSTPEAFFAKIDPQFVVEHSLRTVFPGCYTSMSNIKKKHAELENNLWFTEKICSVAALRGLIEYPEAELDTAVEDLLNAQFHDVLPGSGVRAAEENGLMLLDHGLLILNKLRARAYFALSNLEEKAKDGEFPILVFNPNPYELETDITCELMLSDQNWSETIHNEPRIYDEEGNRLVAQVVKEESNVFLDWRKRIVFRGKLKPLCLTRFSIYFDLVENTPKVERNVDDDVVVDLPAIGKYVKIDGKTGLLTSYKLNGKEYIGEGGAFEPLFFEDNADPWAMWDCNLVAMGRNPVPFELMKNPDGPFVGMKSVQICEDGDVLTAVEAFFARENTKVRVRYDIYKSSPEIDVTVDAFMQDADRMLKLRIPVAQSGEYIGQTAFGTEVLYNDGRECVAQRFTAVRQEDGHCLALMNAGTYGSSYRENAIEMSLIRGASYCAHAIGDRPLIPSDKFVKKIDMGERNFRFRLIPAHESELDRLAGEFNMPPYACNVFPLTDADYKKAPVPAILSIEDKNVVLVTMKKQDGQNATILRLYNGAPYERKTAVTFCGTSLELTFGKYEVKTLRYSDGKLTELHELVI